MTLYGNIFGETGSVWKRAEASMMKKLAIIWMIIAFIGLISFITKARIVNLGAFIFPFIISVYLFYRNKMDKNK